MDQNFKNLVLNYRKSHLSDIVTYLRKCLNLTGFRSVSNYTNRLAETHLKRVGFWQNTISQFKTRDACETLLSSPLESSAKKMIGNCIK